MTFIIAEIGINHNGSIDIAKKLSSYKLITALTKQHEIKDIKSLLNNNNIYNFISLSCGTSKDSYDRLNKIISKYPSIKFICIDVANGYSENFSYFVSNRN